MKKEIIEMAKGCKISDIGFCSMKDYFSKDGGVFFKNTPLNFEPKTAVVCLFNYYVGEPSGNVSRYAWGMDYHKVVCDRMGSVASLLQRKGFFAKCYADTGCLNERLLAKLSGVAFIGKNQMAISPKFGSFFFIGYILTDCEIAPDTENASQCDNCGACMQACPLGAIRKDDFCAEKCLSGISQKRGELSPEEIEALSAVGKIWGCDLCQEVCPHNRNIPETEIEEFKMNLIRNLSLEEMTNREFKQKYGDRAFSWRGKSVILRNQSCIYNRKEKNNS